MLFLLIDDEPDITLVIERVLKTQGHQCRCVVSAAEALRALEEDAFERVVSDLKMPGMTGDALYEILVSRGNPISRRMAFITGNSMESQNREFLERTRVLVLEKPFTITKLREFIHQVEELGEGNVISSSSAVD